MFRLSITLAILVSAILRADDAPAGPDGKPLFGHSVHGEAFDEGPRQAAVLIPGTGDIDFPVTAKSAEAQKFFNQGVGQLHGFWYYEAERSFRQVAKLEPTCAMAYWGLAMANINNDRRAGEFMKQAMKHRASASPREQLYIDALNAFHTGDKKNNPARRKALVKGMEKLVFEFPDDIEAKAFLVFFIWDNAQKGIPLSSHAAVAALIDQVLARNPMHPGAHHYSIHLWNGEDDRRALKSAALCGQSAPGIAHLWHMPGHTFTKLRRYADAAWQQEASARTDHAYMISTRLMPEQIHNYAHNNDWLVENLGFVGRVHDAVDLAKNMIELPRLAPGSKLVGKDGYRDERNGFALGKRRLMAALLEWGHWDELLALDGTMYLAPAEDPIDEAARLRAVGVAAFQKGETARGEKLLAALDGQIAKAKQKRSGKPDGAAPRNRKETASARTKADPQKADAKRIDQVESYGHELRAYAALSAGKLDEARASLEKAGDFGRVRLSQFRSALGDAAKAEEVAQAAVKQGQDQVLPLANLADILWRSGKKQEAIDAFKKLRPLCMFADADETALTRLNPIAAELNLPADWRPEIRQKPDIGNRPDLAGLGPFRWHPYAAPGWRLEDDTGAMRSLADFKGKPVLVVFYLGSKCSHCIEQLNTFAPLHGEFADAGISIVAVGTEPPDELHKTFAKSADDAGFPFPILSDARLAAFKAYRAFDDFENTPLHGTFLIDGSGQVRWQDISYQPFTQAKWLLAEAKRLLALPANSKGVALSSKTEPDNR
jgi:peroxiredoxin